MSRVRWLCFTFGSVNETFECNQFRLLSCLSLCYCQIWLKWRSVICLCYPNCDHRVVSIKQAHWTTIFCETSWQQSWIYILINSNTVSAKTNVIMSNITPFDLTSVSTARAAMTALPVAFLTVSWQKILLIIRSLNVEWHRTSGKQLTLFTR